MDELDPRKIEKLHERMAFNALTEEMVQDFMDLGIVRYEPENKRYFLAVDREEGLRRLKEYQALRRAK